MALCLFLTQLQSICSRAPLEIESFSYVSLWKYLDSPLLRSVFFPPVDPLACSASVSFCLSNDCVIAHFLTGLFQQHRGAWHPLFCAFFLQVFQLHSTSWPLPFQMIGSYQRVYWYTVFHLQWFERASLKGPVFITTCCFYVSSGKPFFQVTFYQKAFLNRTSFFIVHGCMHEPCRPHAFAMAIDLALHPLGCRLDGACSNGYSAVVPFLCSSLPFFLVGTIGGCIFWDIHSHRHRCFHNKASFCTIPT